MDGLWIIFCIKTKDSFAIFWMCLATFGHFESTLFAMCVCMCSTLYLATFASLCRYLFQINLCEPFRPLNKQYHCRHLRPTKTCTARYFVLSLKPGIEFAFFDRIKSMILKARSKKGRKQTKDIFFPGKSFSFRMVACEVPFFDVIKTGRCTSRWLQTSWVFQRFHPWPGLYQGGRW